MNNMNENENNKKSVIVRAVKLSDAYEEDQVKSSEDNNEILKVKYFENDKRPKQVRAYDESELLRIVRTLEETVGGKTGKSENEPELWGILFVDVNKSTKKYEAIQQNNGVLELVHFRYVEARFQEEDESKGKRKKQQKTIKPTGETERFKRLMCGSSHSRNGKAVFIREELYEAVHKILLGGMGKPNGEIAFKNGCAKWNAYYALAATDSIPVTTPDKIIVIKDFKRTITTKCDVVTMENENDKVKYSLYNNRDYEIETMPFDGAGLVSVEMAKQWRSDLGLLYIPASFQIRAIPGIKGNVFTFDIAKFAEEKNNKTYEIRDINGKTVTFGKDEKVVILTKSQVKFLSMYKNMDEWREIFDKAVEVEVNGKKFKYQRTFNISEYSPKQSEVKKFRSTAYQHLQTVKITGEDAEKLVRDTMLKIREISKDIYKFLEYRCVLDETDGDEAEEKSEEILPPYYKAAAEYMRKLKEQNKDEKEIKEHLEKCFADNYFVKKMEDDIKARKDGAYSGKLIVSGNYQVFTPDLFALCEYAFGKEPNGLLKDDEIYSAWWLKCGEEDENYKCGELAITRNPQIYMESRIVKLARGEVLDKWFSYQKTGILISSHSHVPYALGTADFDGDTVATTNNAEFIDAVKTAIEGKTVTETEWEMDRETNTEIVTEIVKKIEAGNGNTIYLENDTEKINGEPDCEVCAVRGSGSEAPFCENMNDIKALMTADLIAFKNNIGTVVNLITKIWNFDQNSEGYRYYLKKSKREDGAITKSYRPRPLSQKETDIFLAERRNYLKIMSVIGQLTLDAAKTGDEVVIPEDIKNFIKNNSIKGFKDKDKMPSFMRHTKKPRSKFKDSRFALSNFTLTMDAIEWKITRSLDQERSDLHYQIRDEYQEHGSFSPDLEKTHKELCEQYEKEYAGGSEFAEMTLGKLVDAILERSVCKQDFEEFKKIAYVGDVDDELYEAAKEALKIAYTAHSSWSNGMENLDPKDKQKMYRIIYRRIKRALRSLNVKDKEGNILRERFDEDERKGITAGALLDCYIIAAEEITADKSNQAKTAPKDVLWNCFGEEITRRIEKGRTEEDEGIAVLGLKGAALEADGNTRGDGKMAFDVKNSITFFDSDLEFIREKVEDAYKGKGGKKEQKEQKKMLLLCAALAVITKDRACKKKKNEKGFTAAELTMNKAGFARECMCIELLGDVKMGIRVLENIDEHLKILTEQGFLKEDKGRYSVAFPAEKAGDKEVFTEQSNEAYEKAAKAILSEMP